MSERAENEVTADGTLRARLVLPAAPSNLSGLVKAWREPVEMLTFMPDPPDKNPMFLERRVYQGSSGRVYPLPFYDRIATAPQLRMWDAFHIENEFVRLMVLPEIGGRIHVGFDKRNGYDFFYRQNVIRPALVGLAGPWASGGIEFNWPQHHRPATFMPVHAEIEEFSDGSATIWCSDHDPMQRMKGMHGLTLHPDCARVDLKVRLYNRTPYTQTFLWWANVATKVHERYQSFFPPDVAFVADHAKRAITSFPLSDRPYYGVDYPERAVRSAEDRSETVRFIPDGRYPANDLSWYANIPVPTSYMITNSNGDFCGGYDHAAQAGVVHVANHHIVPGKKQWTWGNEEFGYAWDRSLTLDDGPYIELMAGAYTDNQPDFSFLSPWETKSFTQSWYPLLGIGIPQVANVDAALHVDVLNGFATIAVQVTRDVSQATILLCVDGQEVKRWSQDLTVAGVFCEQVPVTGDTASVSAEVLADGHTVIAYDPATVHKAPAPEIATEPANPINVASVEELYLTGLHLEQYRHATRDPMLYWREALRRDPNHSDTLNAVGLWHMQRGELTSAVECFRQAIARLTLRNSNPKNGETHYNLGVALRHLGQTQAAYDAFYKATWNSAWHASAYFALAEIDAARGDVATGLDHLNIVLSFNAQHLHARNLKALLLHRCGRSEEAHAERLVIQRLDPLDLQSRWRMGGFSLSGQEALDLAFDCIRCGDFESAVRALHDALSDEADSSHVMLRYTLAHVLDLQGLNGDEVRRAASSASVAYCFPSRLEELMVLENAVRMDNNDATAKYLLGLLLYDRRRHVDAMALWESAAEGMPGFATVWRNLGIARFNIGHDSANALEAYERAVQCGPEDGRVIYERDQLWKRVASDARVRLDELNRHAPLVQERDDLAVEFATLLNQVGRPAEALSLLLNRQFQPWEGGEGLVLQQYVRAKLLLAQDHLRENRAAEALAHLEQCYHPPQSLSEAKHPLANWAHVDYWLGMASAATGFEERSRAMLLRAAAQKGDFQQMAVMDTSTMTYWTGMAQMQLRHVEEARATFHRIAAFADALEGSAPKIDYFATSLPSMLLFDDDLEQRQRVDVLFLRAQSSLGLAQLEQGSHDEAEQLLRQVLSLDPNHAEAADLLAELRSPVEVY